jgi:hypothetical protein
VQPVSTAAVDGDCDDAQADVNPAATEICNGLDDDCDPATPEDQSADATAWFTDTDLDGFGTGASISACVQPPDTSSVDGDCDDDLAGVNPSATEVCNNGIDEDCSGAPDDGCPPVDHCGPITADETWGPGEHLVTCSISIGDAVNSPTLTIADGATVRFAAGTSLTVGTSSGGHLVVADADPTADVLMTSSNTTPAGGDWTGIRVLASGTATIHGATLEYAGGNFGALDVEGSSTLSDATLRHNSNNAVYVHSAASVSIQTSTLSDNGGYGLELETGTTLTQPFADNVVTGNVDGALRVFPDHILDLRASSTYVGNGSAVRVRTGNATLTGVWEALDSGLYVEGPVAIQGASGPEITMEAGLSVEFDPSANLRVGLTNSGGLRTQGVTGSPVRFHGDGTPGSWTGLVMGPATTLATLYGLHVEDAGGSPSVPAAIELEGVAGADLGEVSVVRSAKRGIYAHSGTTLALANSTIEDNAEEGVMIDGGCVIDGNFGNNTLAQNAVPLRMNVDQVVNLQSNVLTGNTLDAIELFVGSAETSGSWQSWGVPYIVETGFTIQGGATLNMLPGTQLLMGGGQSITVGGSTSMGGLTADGWVVGSASAVPMAGDWGGIVYQNTCIPSSSTIINSTLSYGGGSPRFATVEFQACDGGMADTVISDSAAAGVYVAPGTSAGIAPTVVCSAVAFDCQDLP